MQVISFPYAFSQYVEQHAFSVWHDMDNTDNGTEAPYHIPISHDSWANSLACNHDHIVDTWSSWGFHFHVKTLVMRQNVALLPEAKQVQTDVRLTMCPSHGHFLNVVSSCGYLKHEAEKENVNICPRNKKQPHAGTGGDALKKLKVIQ